MSDIVSQVSSSISGLRREFDVIAHNMANVSTVGFKRRCNTFSKSLMAQDTGTQAETGDGSELESVVDFTQGGFVESGRPLDFALAGKGFFVIETPEGQLYTRNGMFRLNQNGQVVDAAGRLVAGESGPITIPPNIALSQVSVSSEGRISGAGAEIGKFRLADFKENEKELVMAGASCFAAPADVKPEAAANLIVKQGYQESSNVHLVEELVDMMMVSRLYEANMQFISARRDTSRSIIDVAMS